MKSLNYLLGPNFIASHNPYKNEYLRVLEYLRFIFIYDKGSSVDV